MNNFGNTGHQHQGRGASQATGSAQLRKLRAALCLGTATITRSILGCVPLATASALAVTSAGIVQAQQVVPAPEIGDEVTDPQSGERLTVIAVFDGAVLTENYSLIFTNPAVGGTVPDPLDGSVLLPVTQVTVNLTTGLVDTVTLADGRVLAVSRNVRAQALPVRLPDSGSALDAGPLPVPTADRDLFEINRPSADGARGADSDGGIAGAFSSPATSGGNGATRVGESITVNDPITVVSNTSGAIIRASGGNGGRGGNGTSSFRPNGANGGNGGRGPTYTLRNEGTISVAESGQYGLFVTSRGGNGGRGGDGELSVSSNGGDGGNGGAGGDATALNRLGGIITTYGDANSAIFVRSIAGRGGSGGDGDTGFASSGGTAGRGADGGTATGSNLNAVIHTFGRRSHGILAQSIGGAGGDGGDAGGLVGFAGSARDGGNGGTVSVRNSGLVQTRGADAAGIVGQSIGGGGGDSGGAGGLLALGADAGAGSDGGTVEAFNSFGRIETAGDRAFGVVAQSIGGGGGTGGFVGGAVALGSKGSGGGNGGTVSAFNQNGGLIRTLGRDAHGLVAQSIGGGGGTGGSAGGVVNLGAEAGAGGSGGLASADNSATILTAGINARGILVQSIGGGGGAGGSTGGVVNLGGTGSGGGNGARAQALNSGIVSTIGFGGDAVLVQSIGGGGGYGGSAAGAFNLGARGGRGGSGSTVSVGNTGNLFTAGDFARGILAQSIGGGGGSGGGAGGLVAVGGRSSVAGNGGRVEVNNGGTIATAGSFADGIKAQSIGGGGGSGGSGGGGLVVVGGRSGGGGSAGAVDIVNSGLVETTGDFANGIFAQSIGGGGGTGGQATSISAFVGVAVGGEGGNGGAGGTVTLESRSRSATIDGVARELLPLVRTSGDFAKGIYAQSVGGGGGNGGAAIQGAAGAFGALSVAVGGAGAGGGNGGTVNLLGRSIVLTAGDFSHGIEAQSVGGGGGNGGAAIAVTGSAGAGASGSISVGVGGRGETGGRGGTVILDAGGFVGTSGLFSHGLLAQSVGGGGGNGGFAISVAAAASVGVGVAIPVGIGGSGGSGGIGGIVDLEYVGDLVTEGDLSAAMLAQSVGGGGGNGGFAITSAVSATAGAGGGVAVGVGGNGGTGGDGNEVTTRISGDVTTRGDYSVGLVTQSVGGSGGNGGYNISGTIAASGGVGGGISVGVGGDGSGGGNGALVRHEFRGNLLTTGYEADGILAQSIGGSGGNGALNVSGAISGSAAGAAAIAVGIGGSGGGGGTGGAVEATFAGTLETLGDQATGFTAQSIGGGGGNGALNVSGAITGSAGTGGAVAVGIGGSGGGGGAGGVVEAFVRANTITRGRQADAIVAQSIGGSGGNGGVNVGAGMTIASSGATIGVGIGGAGGTGGAGRRVQLRVDGATETQGRESTAILAQSVGGGGGNGGLNVASAVTLTAAGSGAIGVGVGGSGGGGGTGGAIDLIVEEGSTVRTLGGDSAGIMAQSLGGGGGNGAINVVGTLSASSTGTGGIGVGVGGFGGAGGAGADVSAAIGGSVVTSGTGSDGVLIQSLGGGGGNGGLNVTSGIALSGSSAGTLSVGVGGFGGTGGNGAIAELVRIGDTITSGASSDAIIVQSIGGGGGNGGANISGGVTFGGTGSYVGAIGIGGFGASAGNGGAVTAAITGSAIATGADDEANGFELDFGLPGSNPIVLGSGGSHGLFAQSVGGSGGTGALNISGGVALGGTGAKALALGVGGFGGGGGNGSTVDLVLTDFTARGTGDRKAAVAAQSIGGGGGEGGVNISGGVTSGGTITAGVGGFGSAGGIGDAVTINLAGNLKARGIGAFGLIAQSIGGGGGLGGTNISGGIAAGGLGAVPAVAFGMGGTGGDGSEGGVVTVRQSGSILVEGAGSTGLFAQSVGGGGGVGGLNIASAVAGGRSVALAAGVGGSGGAGAFGQAVSVTSDGAITVLAAGAEGDFLNGRGTGILAQSIGGGGGNAGLNIAGAATNAGTPLTLGIGGSGAAGGLAGSVTVERGLQSGSSITVAGDNGAGILAQSIGGGGGNAGANVLLSTTIRASYDLQLAIGGSGGDGGDGGGVTVRHIGDIAVGGDDSTAIYAQSIGGGGGNAAINFNASVTASQDRPNGQPSDTRTLDLQIGGGTGEGADAGDVLVVHSGNLTTSGDRSVAVFAQSIGGGGGNAASNYSNNLFGEDQISIGIGRVGGSGGLGGNVEVDMAAGLVATSGAAAHGVHAQSIGGGGGNSDTIAFSGEGAGTSSAMNVEVAVGLEGGIGSAAGRVIVNNRGLIETIGTGAHGIYAQSIGGGGGNGGTAIIDLLAEIPIPNPFENIGEGENEPKNEYSAAVQVGGRGGSGSFGGSVSVANSGAILTAGDEANAIRAMSLGGGGGDAGAAFNLETAGDGDSISFAVAIGGTGGPGSDGGAVSVANRGLLQTTGSAATAILAQSIGGGGGNAGLAGNLALLAPDAGETATVIALNMGGEGGTGGAGGAVQISNGADGESATILTLGAGSHAIHAQSIGGGGGNGGSTLSGNFTTGNTYQMAVNIGGRGGSGGTSGVVTVDNLAAIETRGDAAHGIFAQSIGGGGGNGGLSLALGNLFAPTATPRQAMFAMGGAGGAGNDAAAVVVTNTGSIVTAGRRAHGIFAQSLGGGGGNMGIGLGLTGSGGTDAAVNFLANTIGFALGGFGSEGGEGGTVVINQFGDIRVSGEAAQAVLGQSINGGGGGITVDLNGIAGFLANEALPGTSGIELPELPALTLFGGAAGTGDAHAERVTINMRGNMDVLGDNGAGFDLAAIGGGGGRFDLAASFTEAQDPRAVALPVTAGLGGSDSFNVNGGDIDSSQTGQATTQGINTPALLLQSIGGGGGRATLDFEGRAEQIGDVLLTLGGNGLAAAAGGEVTHRQEGRIATLGAGSVGLLAQSIGGGGGVMRFAFADDLPDGGGPLAGVDAIVRPSRSVPATASLQPFAATPAPGPQPIASVVLGSVGGSGLDGGATSIVQTGDVMTFADDSPAMLVQSIGAGGGYIALDGANLIDATLGASGGASGNGGAVELTLDGMVYTEGAGAHGLVLQSIGGGGGFVSGAGPQTAINLSAGGIGDGGSVALTLTGDIVIAGTGGSAIIAQSLGGGGGAVDDRFAGSAGGSGAGGAVSLAIDGDVSVTAPGATAIIAQSLGSAGGGNITVELAEGHRIQFGLGGTGLAFSGGADNLFINRGTVTSTDGLATMVMTGTSGNDRIENFGIMAGGISLGGGNNAVANLAGGTLLTGAIIDLGGSSGLLSNAGVLAPGGTDTIMQTRLLGSFMQGPGGQTFMEIDLAGDLHDAIDATGSAMLEGSLDVRLLNPSDFQPGTKAYRIVTAAGGTSLAALDLRADSSVVLGLRGISASGNAIELAYDMTFAPEAAIGNQRALGQYLDRIQAAGVPDALSATFDQLVGIQDTATYVGLLNQLGADFYARQDVLAVGLAQRFGDTLVNCGVNGFRADSGDKRTCAWAQGSISDGSWDPLPGSPEVTEDVLSFSGGGHYALGERISLALAVGYDDLDMGGFGGAWQATGSAIQVGGGAAYHFGATRVAAYASYGEVSFDTTRAIAGFGVAATATRDVSMLGAQLVAAHQIDAGGFTILPQVAAGLTRLGGGDAVEADDGDVGLAVASAGSTYGWAMPELRVGYRAALSPHWSIRPFAGGAMRFLLSGETSRVTARLRADNRAVAPFDVFAPLENNHFIGEAGVELLNTGGVTVAGAYRLERSSGRKSDGGFVNIVVPF